jgi:uncharacterized metal-binding protein YceD (DUF177 family)
MTDEFKIYIERLKGGPKKSEVQKIEGAFSSQFLDLEEPELQFLAPVKVKGEAYLTEDHLVIHLSASTCATMPCAICNEMAEAPLKVDHFYHTEPLVEIPSGIYDFRIPLREALLIELPRTIECNRGQCPSRENLAPFMRKEKSGEEINFPFSNLENLES